MASPQSTSGAGAQQLQAGAAPETVWIPFIQDLYPDLLSQTHFLPPIHFNRTPQTVETIAGQTVLVRENPSSSGRGHQPPAPPPAQVAGTVFVENSPNVQPFHTQDSDRQDDTAQYRCIRALSSIPNQVMMVISSLEFQKYLNNHTNPLHAAAIAQLPGIRHTSIPAHIAAGECDIIIIHRQYGLLVGEIKSIGGKIHFRQQSPSQQTQTLIPKLERAVRQLQNQETALRHLVSDLPPVRITKTLLLPNISSRQLHKTLLTSPSLLKALCQALSLKTDVALAVGHCLCKKGRKRPSAWWNTLHRAGPDQEMTDGLYERLVARFCGPATTVDIPTSSPPRKVVRSWGEAVAETGLRFSSLTLTPTQVTLLDRHPEPQFLYLQGPPGTGKTVVLLLKALQWARQGRQVVIMSGDHQSRAVTMLIEAQLLSILGPAAAAAARVQRHYSNFHDGGFDARTAVCSLLPQISPGPVLVLLDEVGRVFRDRYIHWLTEIRAQLPAASVWAAGVYTLDKALSIPLPSWLEVQTLQEALRCPPNVTRELQQSDYIQTNCIPPYCDPQVAVATQGPPVQRLQHEGQPGHSGHRPWLCVTCTDTVADIIRQLRVGHPGHSLQYRDVWILYGGGFAPSAANVMVQRLQQHHGLPVRIVTSHPLSQADARELALAVTDEVMVTRWQSVQGLERRVVVVLGAEGYSRLLLSQSRCSSSLHIID